MKTMESCDGNDSNAISHTITDMELETILAGTVKYTDWPGSLKALHSSHPNMRLGGDFNKKAGYAHIIAFLVSNPSIALNRSQLLRAYQHIMDDDRNVDVIQYVNKCDQRGLRRITYPLKGRNTVYGFPVLQYDGSKLMKRERTLTDDEVNGNTAYIRDLGRRMMTEPLEEGHRNPYKPLNADNLVMQPHSLNAAYKDKYIFNVDGLPSVPNPTRLIENPNYYTDGDDDLLAALAIASMKACADKGIDLDDANLISKLKEQGYQI